MADRDADTRQAQPRTTEKWPVPGELGQQPGSLLPVQSEAVEPRVEEGGQSQPTTRPQQAPDSPPPAAPQVQVVVSQNVNQQAFAGAGVLRRNWVVALVLAILLGWLGIDSFYLGQAGKGVLKFFTLGLFGILWLVDVVMIATKSVRHVEWV
jgi:restriction system protein